MHAEVFQSQPRWQRMIAQRPRGFGDEHLAPVAGRRHPCGAMDVEPEILVPDESGLAGVDTDPYAHGAALRPFMRVQGCQDGRRARAGLERAAEHDEEGITLGAELVATVGGERLALDRVMRQEDFRITLAELLDEARGPLDVAEEEGPGAGRQRAHAGDAARLKTGSRRARSSARESRPRENRRGCGGG